jgi:uncharacterized phage protein gp47/JayE
MPWITPSLRQVREMVRDDVTVALNGAAIIGNTVLRVMSDAQAGLARLILKYLDWLALQLMVDTAEREWLDRHGQIWLVNSDGSLGRKNAVSSQGTVGFTGTAGTLVPEGTGLLAATGDAYETLEFKTLDDPTLQPTEIAVRALNPGATGNQPSGTPLALTVPLAGVDEAAVIDLRGGTDIETDEQLRQRVLERIRKPPMGGDADDYVEWAKSINSVTRAWCAPRELGAGTITLRFMVDALRPDNDGLPTQEDINVVTEYLDGVRPVAIKDFFVMAPVPIPINFDLVLMNDSLTLRSQVEASVAAMINDKAAPAHAVNGELVGPTTIMGSWISEAVNRVTSDFELDTKHVIDDLGNTSLDFPMPHNGGLAVPGTITYPTP